MGDVGTVSVGDLNDSVPQEQVDLGPVGKDVYMLTGTGVESNRLNQQHQLLKKTVGYLLHPEVQEHITTSSSIADIGTGTGIVVLDLEKSLPSSTQLHGNVSLRVYDAKQPPCKELRNKYDVIHLRYLNSGMGEEDWEVVTQNIFTMLKPGGYIQWLESDFGGARGLRANPFTTAHVHEEIHRIMRPQLKHWSFAPRELEDILLNQGFQDVRQEVLSTDRIPELRRAWSLIEIGAMEGFFPGLRHGFSEGECREKLNAMKEEAQGDVYVRWNIHVWIGRKPLPN
ncbi:hypothetical protein M409DRAFT_30246 [Zasmidium cellare ATCC 36951]|uniref:Methyltransferase domain-containing protein n=1 Tax=Zasmidium cellare ATCC 36951 TaxID=1080233 RepID=A0A6A6BZ96_ZASCE|nr:uncharacterized protein M409DRAFT_30246 [Zasmidium cellare ATCC 36951]KAF2159240.1 hypothetical protein M409DRAFT_30246 [Zasmidium cellare ATCC 36951]